MKPFWLFPAFLLGGLAGALIVRSTLPHPPERVGSTPTLTGVASPAASSGIVADAGSTAGPATDATRQSPAPRPPETRADAFFADAPVVTTIGGAPVDLGPGLRKSLADPSVQRESPLELHAALEKEAKDDSWSYPLEAEIRNSLTAISQNGAIEVHTVECRSTLCEIRLSADDSHGELLNGWNRQVGSQPWSQRVLPISQYMTTSEGRVEQLMILRRPPANVERAP